MPLLLHSPSVDTLYNKSDNLLLSAFLISVKKYYVIFFFKKEKLKKAIDIFIHLEKSDMILPLPHDK